MDNNEKTRFSWPLIGNRQVTNYLEKCIIKGNIGGSYIFHGPDDLGKSTLARHFAQILLCTCKDGNLPCRACSSCRQLEPAGREGEGMHGDLYILKKEADKKFISVEQTREFIRKLGMSSFLNSYKIGIIKQAENLNREAANALLKTMEEPKEKVLIILSVNDLESLPATIASRSQLLNFYPVKSDIIFDYLIEKLALKRSEAGKLSRLCLGRPALAVKFAQDRDFLKDHENSVNVFLNFLDHNIKSRFDGIESIINPKEKGQEAVNTAHKTLMVWQGALRDLFLIHYGFNDLVQHSSMLDKIGEIRKSVKISDLLLFNRALKEAGENLRANVNPKLVLEDVAVKFG